MTKRILSVAMVAFLAACGGGDDAGETTTDSTTVQAIPGEDTINQPTIVPATDSIVTTTTQTTDTVQGQATDTTAGDTAH